MFYFNWLTNERGIDEVEAPLSPISTISALITGDGNLSLSISKDETIKTGNQFSQRKVKLLLTKDEFRPFNHLVYYIAPFRQCRKQNVKNSTQSLSSETLTGVEHPVGEEIDTNYPSLPKEIQHLVKEERVNKIVHYNKTERISECFMVHMKHFLTEFNCYELFYVK